MIQNIIAIGSIAAVVVIVFGLALIFGSGEE